MGREEGILEGLGAPSGAGYGAAEVVLLYQRAGMLGSTLGGKWIFHLLFIGMNLSILATGRGKNNLLGILPLQV